MSQTSSKQRYTQFVSWLDTFKKTTPKTTRPKPQSRLDYYSKKGN